MTLQQFKTLIENLQSSFERSSKLHDIGVDLLEYNEMYNKIIDVLLEESFGEEGKDWIDWYLYERPSFSSKEPCHAYDKYGKEICHNIESLWDTVISPNDK